MSAILPGYEYDIFISYRLKDNKYDGWVTEFVNNLQKELEATFKEDITIYFDENPHDGLLETHDVKESLKDKLKCLIFIPIISQTYCDPKSFAWTNEFIAFRDFAVGDQLGLKIKVVSGNVASRILPVRIHNLDKIDVELFENESNSKLRSIDFIYQSKGIVRPLRAKDDDLIENRGQVLYRNQIARLAFAIRELINGIQEKQLIQKKNKYEKGYHQPNNRKKIVTLTVLGMLAFASLYFLFPQVWKKSQVLIEPKEKPRVAILPFKLIGEKEGEYFAAGMKEVLVKHLQLLDGISVPPSLTATDKYLQSTLSHNDIASELRADYLIDASTQKWSDSIRIMIRLIDPRKDIIMWQQDFRQAYEKVFDMQSRIAKEIAQALQLRVTAEINSKVNRKPTDNLEAYDLYLKGRHYGELYIKGRTDEDRQRAVAYFKKSVEKDPSFAEPYALWSVWFERPSHSYFQHVSDSVWLLIDKAISLYPDFADAIGFKAQLKFLVHKDTLEAMRLTTKAVELDPYNVQALLWLGHLHLYWFDSGDEVLGLQYYIKAHEAHESEAWPLINIAAFLEYIGDYSRGEYYLKWGLDLSPDDLYILSQLAYLYCITQQYDQLYSTTVRMEELHRTNYPDKYDYLYFRAIAHLQTGKFIEALKCYEEFVSKSQSIEGKEVTYATILQKNGFQEKAEKLWREIMIKNIQENVPGFEWLTPGNAYLRMQNHAFHGNTENALEIFEKIKFTPLQGPGHHEFCAIDPALESLWKEPRFKAVIQTERERLKIIRNRVNHLEKESMLKMPMRFALNN